MQEVLAQLKAQLIEEGLDPQTFARLKSAAITRQAWAVQGNSALADYYWSALGDYDDGQFADPAQRLEAVSLEQANTALRALLADPGYVRIEKPLLSYNGLSGLLLGAFVLCVLLVATVWAYRRRPR